MSRRDDFNELEMHCVVCTKPLPDDRRKNAVTCSPECTTRRKDYWRSKQDAKMCRYCYKPSTPEQRLLYRQWIRRPQNAEEEELFRQWRDAQARAEATATKRSKPKAQKVAEPEEDIQNA